jgi:hypothetical protein
MILKTIAVVYGVLIVVSAFLYFMPQIFKWKTLEDKDDIRFFKLVSKGIFKGAFIGYHQHFVDKVVLGWWRLVITCTDFLSPIQQGDIVIFRIHYQDRALSFVLYNFSFGINFGSIKK